jgi:hypothetical protein
MINNPLIRMLVYFLYGTIVAKICSFAGIGFIGCLIIALIFLPVLVTLIAPPSWNWLKEKFKNETKSR